MGNPFELSDKFCCRGLSIGVEVTLGCELVEASSMDTLGVVIFSSDGTANYAELMGSPGQGTSICFCSDVGGDSMSCGVKGASSEVASSDIEY
ncbi:hypothetical protein THIOM_004371 [Candidatus Thiomargarita nelsonii]|uniref:Uncharacterized protein n=1 Tax=Candidatus Thiomargarita nelsonii TaxID=1003181 RepID=A0A176RW61_9GAMM|nr:hypothetical protein THIOM_004371 [Candidatus Thiomargarita nelsonii]